MNELKSFDDIMQVCSSYMKEDELKLVENYYGVAKRIYKGMKRETGEDYIYHPIAVAYILSCLKMDPITIGSALIHEALLKEKMTEEEIEKEFNEETLEIVKNLTKISNIKRTFKKETNVEHDRRVIVGLAENPKALFIKLADRTHNMRTLYVFDEDHQKEIIEETQNILIPIAHRLGIKKIKSELEDLCFKYSKPELYEEVRELVNADEKELSDALKTMKNEISDLLREHEIKFEIISRVKSVYGIGKKLESGRRFSDIYDLLGLRVLVDKVEDCYLIIGLIHSKYKSIPKRFKDFIAKPKQNMYRSIHTTVFGANSHMFEIQVRTYEMDEIAERGVASHWSYKEHKDGSIKTALENKLEKFKSLIESQDIEDNEDFFKNLSTELENEDIYVFTPKGDIVELPAGATPVDFAYKIHSEVGNTLVGAHVNDNIVKLDYNLNDGDIVNLLTKAGTEPNKDWLSFVKTETAKSRIKSYFSKQEKELYIKTGEELFNNYLKKKKINVKELLKSENIKKVFKELKIDNEKDLYLTVGSLKHTPQQIVDKILIEEDKTQTKEDLVKKALKAKVDEKNTGNFIVSGQSNILTNIASCCNPIYGEEIMGFITKGNGVSVHKKECKNIKDSNRLIDVEWNQNTDDKYFAKLKVYVDNEHENLLDIMSQATKLDIVITSVTLINKKETYYDVTCKVTDIELLNKFIEKLNNLKFVLKIER